MTNARFALLVIAGLALVIIGLSAFTVNERELAIKLQVGQVSDPIRTTAGLHLIAVCGRRSAGAAQLDKDQIESRLYGQQLSMIARRYMRDLRNSATIETR